MFDKVDTAFNYWRALIVCHNFLRNLSRQKNVVYAHTAFYFVGQSCSLLTRHIEIDREPLFCSVAVSMLYPLSKTKAHGLCGASQGNKDTRHKGTAYGYRALMVLVPIHSLIFFKHIMAILVKKVEPYFVGYIHHIVTYSI